MSAPIPIALTFGESVTCLVRARIGYAFRVFAAIYNYRVVETSGSGTAIRVTYGVEPPKDSHCPGLQIPARYRPREDRVAPGPPVKFRYANEDLYLSHGIDPATGNPDWLGELFEWISSSYEEGIQARDSVGRIPYSGMIFAKQAISPRKPYATLLMAWMEHVLRHGNRTESFVKAASPVAGSEHLVVCSHDIDFYYVDRLSALVRLAKNLGISLLAARNLSFFRSNANLLAAAMLGRRTGDFLPPMLEKIAGRGFRSTLFVLPRRGHRRDANYDLRQLIPRLSAAASLGFSADLHGSYTSIIEGGALRAESAAFEKAMGKRPLGSRQHWLRFDRHKKLFAAIEAAGLTFDSTLGFSERVGFRNGASFAFPPYDFQKERPYPFLEIPLVLMDVSLEAESRAGKEDPQVLANEVLEQSRRWGWGGISVLWHNPLEPLHVSNEINEVFWNCAPQRERAADQWTTADSFIAQCLGRYQNAGLMEGARGGG